MILYPQLVQAEVLSRSNRFIAYCRLHGEIVVCHVKNTGRCKELLVPGCKVYLAPSDQPARKTHFDLVCVENRGYVVNIDSQAPNRVFAEWALAGSFLPELTSLRPEVCFGSSRFDFAYRCHGAPGFAEVKGVTLFDNASMAYFPDAPTERGIKHVYELIAARRDGYDAGLVTCQQGVFLFIPPAKESSDWDVQQLMTQRTSDAALIDLDGDGEEEIATIEPFHGKYFRIYKRQDGVWTQIFEHPETTEFYHVVKAGTLCGRPAFVGGCRRGKQQLFAVTWDQAAQKPVVQLVDEGVGPSNVVIYHGAHGDCIFAADREAAEAAVYFAEE